MSPLILPLSVLSQVTPVSVSPTVFLPGPEPMPVTDPGGTTRLVPDALYQPPPVTYPGGGCFPYSGPNSGTGADL